MPQTGGVPVSNEPGAALPPGAYGRRRAYTRTQATSLSFSWRGKLLWSAPPILYLAWLASGALGVLNPLAWFLGIITVPYIIWWLRHVWTRTPLPFDSSQHSQPRPVGGGNPETASIRLFDWITPLSTDLEIQPDRKPTARPEI
jgi:hypothetical protein